MKILCALSMMLTTGFVVAGANLMVNQPASHLQDQQDEDLKASARQQFMRGKLESNQLIVEGLSTNNFDKVSQGAIAVTALVKGQHWFVIDTPEYKRYTTEMEIAAKRLNEAAEAKNMDAAALRYFDLTLDCLDCHRYIESKRY